MSARWKRLLLLVALCAAAPRVCRAEGFLYSPYSGQDTMFGAAWSFAKPLGPMQDRFLYAWSPAGFEAEFRTRLVDRFSIGGDFTLNDFKQDFTDGTHREFQAIALRVTMHWYLTGTSVQPYVGLGLGGVHRNASQDGADLQTGFAGLVEPQAGVLVTLDRGLALNLSVRYTYTQPSMDAIGGAPGWLAGQVGLAFY